MLSKNNTYLKKKKTANQAQRFGLRKLSIGTVSVLLGTLLFMGNSQASADTTTDTTSTGTEAKTASATTDLNASQVALSSTGSQAAASESAATASQATSSSTTATSQAATNSATAASDTTTDTTKTSTPATSTAAQSKTAVKATVTATPTAETNASIATAEASAATTANSQTTSDDAISAGGKITDEGKTKGLTDSDVTPGMSDANGASLVLDNSSKIPSGYKADPTEGRYTFGIVSLGGDFDPGTSKASGKDINNTTFNGENGKQYYFRFSTKAAASDGKYDDSTVYAQVVDASNNSIVWSNTLTPQADLDNILSRFKLSYTTSTVNGLTTALVNLINSIGTQYSKVIYSAAGDNSMGSTVHVTLPIAGTITTEYIAKDASGAETELATYEETGRQGYTYTASGVRSFVGYDLISSPSSTVGTLSRSYNVGDVLERAREQISDKYQIASVYVITKADGTAKMEMKIASINASSNDYADESVWHTFLTTGELVPGEVSTDGNYDVTSSGNITYKNGAFLLYDSTYQPIGVKYLTAIGISSDDLTREKLGKYKGYMTMFGLNNKLVKGQEPVKYCYAPQGQVRINYITNDGTVIQAPVTAYENSSNNTTYNVSSSTYKPETITVNGKTYRYVKSDKSKGNTGTTEVNGYTYNVTPSDETGRINSNTVNDVYFVYEQITYHTEADTPKTVTRTIEYYDSVTGEPIPTNLESTVTQTATLKRNKIYDDQNNFIGYGTISADGSSYTIDDSWKVDAQTWTQQDSADLSDYGYTAPDRASVAAVTVDGNTTNVTEKVYYGHQTTPVTPTNPGTPGKPINPKGDVNYPDGVAKDDLTDTVTRTINYIDAKGNPVKGGPNGEETITQTVTFERTAIVDKVTGKILGYDTNNDGKVDTENADRAWTPLSAEFSEVKSTDPKSLGFDNVDKSTISTVTIVPGQADLKETVVYSNNPVFVSGKITYIDDTTGVTLDEDALPEGEVGSKINYTTADKIKNYENKGYELVSNTFTDGTQTYAKAGNDFVVHLKHATKTITPEDPATPGQPINPKGNAEYPNGVAKDDLSDTVTRTINYVDADGNPVKGGPNGETTIKQTVTFKRTVIIDKVTGQLLGYDTNNDGQVDTTDAGRAWSPLHGEFDEVESKTPAEVGYLHVDRPKVNAYGVVPGDQDIVEKVVYSNDPMVVAGTIQYIDDTTGVLLDEDALPEGEVGTKISYTTADKIKNYENKGYELVSNNFTDGAQTYSKDGNDFVVHLKHKTQTITPNDPDLVTPGEPINPNDPNSPVYPPATARENLIKAATQTIHYVGAGDQTPADKVQTKEDAFTRTVTIDKVTGKVLSTSDWQGSETFGTENTPVVDGYHADKKTAGGLTATVADPNVEETVTYTPNAKIVPVDPNGNPIPGADTPTYPTDPTDPTKVVPNEPIPDVPGYTPVDPSPITPTDPGKDTPVPYTQNQYGLTEQFVDEDGNELSPSVSKGSSYKHGDAFDVTGDAKVINGYVLVKQENTKGTFGNGDETAKFIYKKLGRIIPVDPNGNPIPGADTPIYQNDPNDPSKVVPNEPTPTVPGYTPSTPSVTPADPTKDTPVPYTKNETPTNPSEPTTPANPTNPSEPTAPGTPTNPTEPSPAVPGQTTPANQQAASSASEDKSATLPQTGNDQNETAAAAGLGLAGLSSLLALFGTRKKRHDD